LAKDFAEVRNTGKNKFICIAIATTAAHSKRITDEDMQRCTKIVESRIQGWSTLEGWLESKGCIKSHHLRGSTTLDLIQAHRHAWLDLLIAEFESKGD